MHENLNCISYWSKNNIVTCTNVENHDYSKELEVFKDYYSKFVESLPANELSHYLVSHRVISLADNEEITKPTTPSRRAAEILLSRVYSSLQNGDVVAFHNLLYVMQQYGNCAMISLCNEIKAQIDGGNEAIKRSHQGIICRSYSRVFIQRYGTAQLLDNVCMHLKHV